MTTPRSIRVTPGVAFRLAAYAARRPGLSGAAVAARLVDEGLRMDEHPGVLFRDGPAGRRATLAGGPDVWEVIRAVRSTRAAEPGLGETGVLELVAGNTGLALRCVRTAVTYGTSRPAEVDALVQDAEQSERDALLAAERAAALLER